MGRIFINEYWHVKFYENKNRNGNPIKEYKCNDLKEVKNITGLSRSHVHKLRTGEVKKSHYFIELKNKNIIF